MNHETNHPPEGEQRDADQERHPDGLRPRIWIASLADSNAGHSHGVWIDADQDPERLRAAAQEVLTTSPTPDAEEWAIVDSEDFGSFRITEHEDMAVVAAVAAGIRQHGAAFAAWAELHDGELGMLSAFTDAYLGAYDSRDEWAESIAEDHDIHQRLEELLPADLQPYVRFDPAAFAHDAWLSGDICVIERDDGEPGVWVFSTR